MKTLFVYIPLYQINKTMQKLIKRQLCDSVIASRITRDEKRAIEKICKEKKVTKSEFVRSLIVKLK